jgi:hypothetical protein
LSQERCELPWERIQKEYAFIVLLLSGAGSAGGLAAFKLSLHRRIKALGDGLRTRLAMAREPRSASRITS